jgi:hypothetical protein
MAVIKGEVDPNWHERELIPILLATRPLQKNDLLNRLEEEQKNKIVFGEEGRTHSRSAYRYWINHHEQQCVVNESGGTVELTPLGRWIVTSAVGTVLERNDFLDKFLCNKCIRTRSLALLKPVVNTYETNARGRLFADMECPKCACVSQRVPIAEALSVGEFRHFYNNALSELQQTMNIAAVPLKAN